MDRPVIHIIYHIYNVQYIIARGTGGDLLRKRERREERNEKCFVFIDGTETINLETFMR